MLSRHFNTTTTTSLLTSALLLLGGCSAETATPEELTAEGEALLGGRMGGNWRVRQLEVSEVIDPLGIGDAANEPTSIAIESAEEYESVFGHAAPAGVDFENEVVVFYSAGIKPTGGYVASILKVVQLGRTLAVATQLESPGAGCATTDALTTPYALVTVSPTYAVRHTRFVHKDTVRDCEPPTCDDIECPTGQHCELQEIVCVTTPCDPIPTCVDDDAPGPDGGVEPPTGPFCGGFGGFPCPGAGECIDDPSDDCDPNMGGADCGGLCVCNAIGLCVDGFVWDGSPEVCGCVPSENPCNLIDCMPGTVCEVQDGEAVCVPEMIGTNPCAFTLCIVGTECVVQDGEAVCVPAGTGGETCGDVTCAAGEVCCNPSCGICTPPDGACIELFCES